MTDKQKKECHAIIHSASVFAGIVGAGLAQLPCADCVPLMGIQATMIISLGKVFGIELSKSAVKSYTKSQFAKQIGIQVSRFAISKIPIAGNISNAIIASSITEAMGWTIANDFAKEKSYTAIN